MLKQTIALISLSASMAVIAEPEKVQSDNLHVRTWNQFAEDILRFHRERAEKIPVTVKEKTGGYANLPDFYIEQKVYHKDLLHAVVTWEKQNPGKLHTIEVFVYDDKDRVIRDYSAAYLPEYRNAPTQTLVSFHHYNNGLHAFRSFDASGYRVIERCTGSYKGNEVDFILDEDEIADARDDVYQKQGIMMTADYQNCFGDALPEELGIYIIPQ